MKAEFIAETEVARELSWISEFMQCLSIAELPPIIISFLLPDNQGALSLSKNNDFKLQIKHIYARERFIAQMIEFGRV